MAWETFKGRGRRGTGPTMSINSSGHISFNSASMELMNPSGISAVTLLYDGRSVGLREADRQNPNAYPALSTGRGRIVTAKAFLGHHGIIPGATTRYPATFEQGILQVRLDDPGGIDVSRPRRAVASELARQEER